MIVSTHQITVVDRSSLNTCSGDGSFVITSNVAPELDGCFVVLAADTSASDVPLVYTVAGETEIVVLPISDDESGEVSHEAMDTVHWTRLHCGFGLAVFVPRSARRSWR